MKTTTTGRERRPPKRPRRSHETLRRVDREERDAGGLDRRQLLTALTRFQKGSFDVRLPEDWTGIDGKIADAFNAVVERNQRMSRELERLSRAGRARGGGRKRDSAARRPAGLTLAGGSTRR